MHVLIYKARHRSSGDAATDDEGEDNPDDDELRRAPPRSFFTRSHLSDGLCLLAVEGMGSDAVTRGRSAIYRRCLVCRLVNILRGQSVANLYLQTPIRSTARTSIDPLVGMMVNNVLS